MVNRWAICGWLIFGLKGFCPWGLFAGQILGVVVERRISMMFNLSHSSLRLRVVLCVLCVLFVVLCPNSGSKTSRCSCSTGSVILPSKRNSQIPTTSPTNRPVLPEKTEATDLCPSFRRSRLVLPFENRRFDFGRPSPADFSFPYINHYSSGPISKNSFMKQKRIGHSNGYILLKFWVGGSNKIF